MRWQKSSVARVVALLAVLAVVARGANPGARISISEKGLEYVKDVGVKILLQQLSSVQVPDQSGSSGTPVGTIDYSITDIVIEKLTLPTSSVSIASGQGVDVAVSDVTCDVNLNFHWKEKSWPHVSGSGSATVSVSETSVDVGTDIGEANERPTIKVSKCGVSIGHFSVDVHGGASWLYNFLISLFEGSLKDTVTDSLQSAIEDAINQQAEQALASIPITADVDQYSVIDYAMLSAPEFSSSSLTSSHLGQFLSRSPSPPSPWAPVALPAEVASSDELNLVLSEEVANSAGFVYFHAGVLETYVDSLPSWSPLRLNTTDFKLLIPPLFLHYPDMAMAFLMAANNTPNAVITSDGARADVTGTVDVYVLTQNKTKELAFTLGLHLFGAGNVSVSQSNITAVSQFLRADLSLVSSEIGDIDVSLLQDIVNLACEKGLVPWLNRVLSVGIPIPVVDGVTLSNIKVSYANGYVGIASDFTYAPPQSDTNDSDTNGSDTNVTDGATDDDLIRISIPVS